MIIPAKIVIMVIPTDINLKNNLAIQRFKVNISTFMSITYDTSYKENRLPEDELYQNSGKSSLDELISLLNPQEIYKTIDYTINLFEKLAEQAKKEIKE